MRALVVVAAALVVLLAADFSSASGSRGLEGGWSPIKNTSDPHVTEIGEYAVSEHNKEVLKSKLALSKVIKGETQVVGGVNYKLVIEAKAGDDKVGRYEVIVWERVWEKFRKLTSFKPVN